MDSRSNRLPGIDRVDSRVIDFSVDSDFFVDLRNFCAQITPCFNTFHFCALLLDPIEEDFTSVCAEPESDLCMTSYINPA